MLKEEQCSSVMLKKELETEQIKNLNDFYMKFKIVKGTIDDYVVDTKIGRGRFSEVFEGKNIKKNLPVVVKILKPIAKLKIKREVKILTELKNGPNIVQLVDVVKDQGTHIYSLIYASVNTIDLKKLIFGINPNDLRLYMYQILKGLDYCHSKGIIHRDIKPGNIVVDLETKDLRIIDWGLAEFYVKDYEYNVRVATKYYKAPELLFHFKRYDYAVDLWSLGCLFAEMGLDLNDQILKIASVVGKDDINNYLKKYPESSLRSSILTVIQKYSKKDWELFKNYGNFHLVTNEAIDLLQKLLTVDHKDRITAKNALQHPYFDKLKLENISNQANI